MNPSKYVPSFVGLSLVALAVPSLTGQENQQDIERLRLEVERIQEQREVDSREIAELQEQIDRLEAEREISAGESEASVAGEDPYVGKPARGVRFGADEEFIDISAIGTFAAGTSTEHHVEDLQSGGHDPQRRGVNVQSLELALSGIIDPYFRAQANLIFSEGGHGHGDEGGGGVELEEAYLETLALPGNLQVRGGLFLTEFGRHNTKHLHAWDFVDQPLISGRMFGPEGLRNPGARVSWLAPTPFYSELFFGVQNATGETAYSFRNPEGFREEAFFRGTEVDHEEAEEISSLSDMLYTTRFASSTDLTDSQTVLAGVSAAFGPNSPTETTNGVPGSDAGRTEIYGADLYWLWSPVDQRGGFPFVSWQTEAMLRRFEMRNPSEVFEDYGFYTQINYGFSRGWVAGLRYDWIRGDMRDTVDPDGEELEFPDRWRLSPNLTYYPSEFSKLRLQYNLDDRGDEGTDHSVWLQVEFSLGPHGAHSF